MTLFTVFQWLHIVSGSIGLLSGTINLVKKKGDKPHRLIGKVFFVSMTLAGVSSLILASIHPNQFLFVIGVFTLYQVLTGQRYLILKKQQASYYEWLLTACMLVFAIYFAGYGAYKLYQGVSFGLVLMVFGLFALLMVKTDYENYTGKPAHKNFWLITHLQRMIGAYIASLTAFLVVNNTLLPGVIAWLLPSVLLVPFIMFWSKKYTSAT